MMSLLGPLVAGTPKTTGESQVTPGPDAGFADLVDNTQAPEAASVAMPETDVALDDLEEVEVLPSEDEQDLVPVAEPVLVPVVVHTVVADLQPPRAVLSAGPLMAAAGLDASVAPAALEVAAKAPAPVVDDPAASAPEADPAIVLADQDWTPVAPTAVEAGPGLGRTADPGAEGIPPRAAEGDDGAVPPAAPLAPAQAWRVEEDGTVPGRTESVTAAPAASPSLDPTARIAAPQSQDESPKPREGTRRAARFGISIERVAADEVRPANVAERPDLAGNHAAVEPGTTALDAAAGEPAPAEPPRDVEVAAAEERGQPVVTPAAEDPAGLRLDGPADPARPGIPQPAAPEPFTPARSAPPPRSPLVQAALDRVLPLPSLAGETVVRLNPAGLGLIEVVVQENRDGALDVALRVQNPMVLEAMRQDQAAVGQAISAAHGGAAGSLSMDLFQSGTGHRGPEAEAHPRSLAGSEAGGETAEAPAEGPALQIVRDDRVNIVT